jgi:tRNA(Arg) A34 adenosine deaminase TadA
MTGISASVTHRAKLSGNRRERRPPAAKTMLSDIALRHLRRCIELARQALAGGSPPFGSLLVGAEGKVLVEDYNQIRGGDRTHHPEMGVARWATTHLAPAERARATVYTSGEHCAMCAAAHGWVGLGRIVYATSAAQLSAWLAEWGVPRGRVRDLSIREVLSAVELDGPAPELADEIRELHRRFFRPRAAE